eukprot:gene8291-biopygen19625
MAFTPAKAAFAPARLVRPSGARRPSHRLWWATRGSVKEEKARVHRKCQRFVSVCPDASGAAGELYSGWGNYSGQACAWDGVQGDGVVGGSWTQRMGVAIICKERGRKGVDPLPRAPSPGMTVDLATGPARGVWHPMHTNIPVGGGGAVCVGGGCRQTCGRGAQRRHPPAGRRQRGGARCRWAGTRRCPSRGDRRHHRRRRER